MQAIVDIKGRIKLAENLAYRHIKVTLQTRVDGLGSSGHCHGVHRVSNIGGLRQQKLIHRNTLHCTALPGLGTGAGRHAALRQLAHSSQSLFCPTVHCSLLEYLQLTSFTAEINCVIQPATKSSDLRQKSRVSIEGFAYLLITRWC